MLRRLRPHLSYANVMATIAVFVALGGSSYAVTRISGSQVKNRSIAGKKLKRNTLGGKEVREARLGAVPRASNAARVGGLSAAQLLVRCPPGTFPAGGTCIEAAARAPASYGTAAIVCGSAGGSATPGRRLPLLSELINAFTHAGVHLAPGGELTGHIYPRAGGSQDVLYVTSETGSTATVANDGTTPRAFRCAADPLN